MEYIKMTCKSVSMASFSSKPCLDILCTYEGALRSKVTVFVSVNRVKSLLLPKSHPVDLVMAIYYNSWLLGGQNWPLLLNWIVIEMLYSDWGKKTLKSVDFESSQRGQSKILA